MPVADDRSTLDAITDPGPRQPRARVLVADDHPIVRQAIAALLQDAGFEVVAEAADGIEAVRKALTAQPDVAILDLRMPGMDGIEAARQIHRLAPGTQTMLLSMYDDPAIAVEALRAGVHGYALKSQTSVELVETVREVARGAIHLSAPVAPAVLGASTAEAATLPDALTARERQVLKLIADGRSGREAAIELGLSVKTIESHRYRIMRKLGVHRSAELIRYAVRHRLVTP